MNNTIRQLLERKSVRSFTEREIDEETVQEILLAAAAAPTASGKAADNASARASSNANAFRFISIPP